MVKTTKKLSQKQTAAQAKPATKKVAKPKNPSAKKSWFRQMWPKQWLMVCLALFLLLILGYIGLNKYQIAQEKNQFNAAEAGLDALYTDIVKTVGQPASYNKDVSCGYSSAEIYKGFLRCGTRYNLQYTAQNPVEADALSGKVMNVVSSSKELTISYKRDYSFTSSTKTVSNYPIIEFIVNGASKPSCSLANYYNDNLNVSVSFGCSKLAKVEYYPLRK